MQRANVRRLEQAELSAAVNGPDIRGDGYPMTAWILSAVMITGVTVAIYLQVASHEFVDFDDNIYVTTNRNVTQGLTWKNVEWAFTSYYAANWHPVTWMSHMLDVDIFGQWAGGHHLTSLAFHILNSLMLLGFLGYTTRRFWASTLVTVLFAVHPLHVESVAWISERKDVLSTFFWMATMLAYLYYVRKPGVLRYVGMAVLFVLGLMSKPMITTLPLVLILLDYWPLERFTLERRGWLLKLQGKSIVGLVLEKVPLMLLSSCSSLVTLAAQRGAMPSYDIIDLPSRLTSAIVSYWRYMQDMFWPEGLAALYLHSNRPLYVEAALLLVLLAVCSIAALLIGAKHKYVLMGWFWYLITLVPVLGLVQVGLQSHADRYTYVPLTGLFIIIIWCGVELVDRLPRLRVPAAIAAAVMVGILSLLAWRAVSFWKDDISLFSRALSVTQNNYRMMTNLGIRLTDMGELDQGSAWLRKSLAIRYNDVSTLNGLGTLAAKQGKYEEAVQYFRAALEVNPYLEQSLVNVGLALAAMGRNDDAAEYFKRALDIVPDWPLAYSYLGQALGNAGKLDEGLAILQKAAELDPGMADAHFGLGGIYLRKGELAAAAAEYQRTVELLPGGMAFTNLGACLMGLGRYEDAEQAYRKAISLEPDNAAAHSDLAVVLNARGRRDEAVSEARKAMELDPRNPDIQARYKYLSEGGQ
jgi:tetratricopeptide (TPR) repeat protein